MDKFPVYRPPIHDKGGTMFLVGEMQRVSGEGARPDTADVIAVAPRIGHAGLTMLILRGNPRLN